MLVQSLLLLMRLLWLKVAPLVIHWRIVLLILIGYWILLIHWTWRIIYSPRVVHLLLVHISLIHSIHNWRGVLTIYGVTWYLLRILLRILLLLLQVRIRITHQLRLINLSLLWPLLLLGILHIGLLLGIKIAHWSLFLELLLLLLIEHLLISILVHHHIHILWLCWWLLTLQLGLLLLLHTHHHLLFLQS